MPLHCPYATVSSLGQAVEITAFRCRRPLESSINEEGSVKQISEYGLASTADAKAWLAKPDVVTAGKITGSIYQNH